MTARPRPWSAVFALACAGVVIATVLVVADQSRVKADHARQAQVQMEHVRVMSNRLDSITWRSLGTERGEAPSAAVARGVAAYREIAMSLRALRRLGVSRTRVAALEQPLGGIYGAGVRAIVGSRTDPGAARRIATAQLSPSIDRLNAVIDLQAAGQGEIARASQERARGATLVSVLGGVLALALLGWHTARVRRRAVLEQAELDAERRGEQRLRALVRSSSDVVAVVDADARVRWLAESVERMLGYRVSDLLSTPLTDFVHPEEAPRAAAALGALAAAEGKDGTLSLRVRAADGSYRHLEVIAENHLADPDVDGILLNLRDVSDRIALEHQLRHQAFHDSLTGLPNRALFEDRLGHALTRMGRHHEPAAVIFIDLDDFKTVNDSLGHAVGDDLLRATSGRLQAALRVQDTAARLGGDEFAVLVEDLDDGDGATGIAERIRIALQEPLMLGTRRITPSASLGLAYLEPGTSAADVLGNADAAMYAAKERGKAQLAEFDAWMRERVTERLDVSGDLTAALERDELLLEYQPVVALDSGRVTGVEALIRWNHPTRGRLAPDRFIGIAESTGLIVPVGRWVLETACAQLSRWDGERHDDGPPLELSVNVSTRQLADGGFPDDVVRILDACGIAADRLTLEITEHVLVEDSELMRNQLLALKDIGVKLAVDDFGTGYSALSYLRSFPIDVLKVDRSFVSGIDRDDEKARLVQGIVELGHNLELGVVAEGIEEHGEAELLRDFRAGNGQGYLFSRPVPPAAILPLLGSSSPMLIPELS